MYITREMAQVLVKLTPEEVEVLHPRFNPDNWKFLVALSQGKDVRIDGRILPSLGFDSVPENYTIVEPTIRIGEIDVPAPEIVPLTYGQDYYIADPTEERKYLACRWATSSEFDNRMLGSGLIHLNSSAATIHADAIIVASGGKV